MNKKMLINGKFVDASDGGVRESTNPLDGQVLGTYPSATKADVEAFLREEITEEHAALSVIWPASDGTEEGAQRP